MSVAGSMWWARFRCCIRRRGFSQYSSGWAVISQRSGGCEAVMAPDAIT